MKFRFDINLRRMAMFSHASALLEASCVPEKLRIFHAQSKANRTKYCDKLVDEVIKKIDLGSLPSLLYNELIVVVKDVVYKLNEWYNFVACESVLWDQRKDLDELIKDVYWTHYGVIDNAKIFKNSWLNIPGIDLSKMYVMACCYCCEELISELWGKLMLGKNFIFTYEELRDEQNFYLVAYWNKLRENNLEDFKRDFIAPFIGYQHIKVYDTNESVEVNMMRLSASKGYAQAVKYFWNKLSEKEKNKSVADAFMGALECYYYQDEEIYKQDQYAEVIIFLLNFLSQELMTKIFATRKMIDGSYLQMIFHLCIWSWPWLDFFKPLFNYLENFLNIKVYRCILLNVSIEKLRQNRFFKNLLCQVWNRIPPHLKSSVVNNKYLIGLFKSWDVSSMKLILNDRNMVTKRNDFIKNLDFDLVSIIKENEFKKLFQFIDEILIPLDLGQKMQELIKSVYDLILKGAVNSIENLLDTVSAEKIKIIKEIIYPDVLCYYFIIKKEFNLAEEFLNWKFNSLEEIEKFKAEFQNNNFTKKHIYSFWKVAGENVELARKNSDEFLFWLLKKEENVTLFKKEKIFPWFSQKRIGKNNIDILQDFLYWCHLNEEAIRNFKNTNVKAKLLEILEDLIYENNFEEADKICNWAFNSEEEKIDFMREYLFSDEGIDACSTYVSKYSYPSDDAPRPAVAEMVLEFKILIKYLARSLTNSNHVKEKLGDWVNRFRSLDLNEFNNDGFVEDENEDFFIADHKLFISLVCEMANDFDN